MLSYHDDGTVLWFTQTDPCSSDTTSSHASDKSRIGIKNSDEYLVFDHSEPRSRRPLTKTALLVMSKWNLKLGITNSGDEQCCNLLHQNLTSSTQDNPIQAVICETDTEVLTGELGDNPSYVLMAPSVLSRVKFKDPIENPQPVDAVVLPRMCLHRCYLASYIPTKRDVQSFLMRMDWSWPRTMSELSIFTISNKRVDNIRVVQQAACQTIAKVASSYPYSIRNSYSPCYAPIFSRALLIGISGDPRQSTINPDLGSLKCLQYASWLPTKTIRTIF
jgi:hypothetical protein